MSNSKPYLDGRLLTTNDHWHFPRPELASRYLKAFELGLTSAKGLFAKRRMGKTEFLKRDLLPAAQANGYRVAYVNLWQSRQNPESALVDAIFAAMNTTLVDKLKSRLTTPVKSVSATGSLTKLEARIEADIPQPGVRPILRLNTVLDTLDKQRRPVLLLIDEAQILAQETHSDFTHALRAGLDTRKDQIKVIFAGSSEATLRRMFAKSSEPFYNWAALEPFELLGRDFVEDLVEKTNSVSKYPLSVKSALEAFEQLKGTPEFFRRFLEIYLIHPQAGAEKALEETRAHIFSDANFEDQWLSLVAIDRLLLKLVLDGKLALHGKEARHQLGQQLGLDRAVDSNAVRQALDRLQNQNILVRIEPGRYQFEDEAMAEWLGCSL